MKLSLLIVIGYAALNATSILVCAAAAAAPTPDASSVITTPAAFVRYLNKLVGHSGLHVAQYLGPSETRVRTPETAVHEFTWHMPPSQEHTTITGLSRMEHSIRGDKDIVTLHVHNGSQYPFIVHIAFESGITNPNLSSRPTDSITSNTDELGSTLPTTLSCDLQPSYFSSSYKLINRGLGTIGGRFSVAVSDDRKSISGKTVVLDRFYEIESDFKRNLQASYRYSQKKSYRSSSSSSRRSSRSLEYIVDHRQTTQTD